MTFIQLDCWLKSKKISYFQYLECHDDIKNTLSVSQDEYLEMINDGWSDKKSGSKADFN